ncbi:hypothetical protein PSN45_001613 [Yamadazyma tenuis]|uniref:Transmembrane 9 superfamily member n=1 Tax=Candida tenuis (strain ATCC 10573 / BCRC 21748 / CBS 615 / JCM 9827 / NBRC 10315 / NRRL Y-1498 / VKM Y-70) TaxID=590646 RepID=G3BF30_CANTC|nr:uncharacterized protein CANTEDRAFT_110996 [Yamadazyma tenuis ATCC 10573]EGV60618.1 hypothetical protein CANTEDRAFT_110996 [Yamadazyma tenuis ATCC 10573]WEJ94134.1 hypothetical protein PSN45_001613 [Yamadazyma tenuis]
MKSWTCLFVVVFSLFVEVSSFNFGLDLGLSPKYYKKGQKVDLLVNKVESDHTQLPFGYFDLNFVCPASREKKPLHISLGEILRGDRLWESDFKLAFGKDISCARLCDFLAKVPQITFADRLIKQGYVVHWSIDGLPGATTFVSNNKNSKYYAAGFPLGFFEDDISYLYNHFMLVIRYHSEKKHPGMHTIVGFEVYPKSVVDETCPGSSKSYENLALKLPEGKKGKVAKLRIPYTYSVYWREDNSIDYANRWELYYANETHSASTKIHWLSFLNSVVLVSLLTLVVVIILVRINRLDSKNSDSSPNLALTAEIDNAFSKNAAWKNLGGAVTKRPVFPLLLSMLVSSGLQLIIATVGIILSVIIKSQLDYNKARGGEFSNYQGAFSSLALSCFVMSGILPSFFGFVLYKIFNNENLSVQIPPAKAVKLSILFSGFLPCLVLSVMLFFNFFVFAKESSNALPFGSIVILLILFFLIVLPLGLIGGYYGNKLKFNKKSIMFFSEKGKDSPNFVPQVNVSTTAKRALMSVIRNSTIVMLIYGLIPFGIVYVELSFIFNSIWLEKTTFYYMYGFLFLTTLSLIIIVSESTIIGIYISLVIENNPNWQWLSFRIGSSIGLYIYAYSIYYFFSLLNVQDFVSILLYFGYMALVSVLIGIAGGSVAVLTGMVFIKKLLTSTKAD